MFDFLVTRLNKALIGETASSTLFIGLPSFITSLS